MTLLESALQYAARGWFVHPLKPRSKEPATAHGVLDASNDPMQIVSWWMENPEYNIGIATGPSDLVVIDIDPRSGGDDGWQSLNPPAVGTIKVNTGGGGRHFYFRGAGRFQSKLAVGVDVKSEGGYVVAPPSTHPEGGRYEWSRAWQPGDVLAVPDWLLPLLTKPEREPAAPVEYDPDDDRPGSIYIRSTNWPDLMEGWGYRRHSVGMDGQIFWTRPGKDSGISAVTGGETDTLWVFSSSTPFDTDRAYNRFGAYAQMEHGGDLSAAARALAGAAMLTVTEYTEYVNNVTREEVQTPETEYAFLFGVS